ncbi:hypothetical protein GCM10010275_04020 [Streptomyces litmocidini]|uniref:DUF2690 domain-containing protein n=1 Tax=Streptomyces litmocidini TaxID=67318 RepID=UPI00167EEEF6|nr:DUF2690 domain-containing protein [Streptomyces litmocidini]GGU72657.1 hypothetical protein GCM10010275_04020 [Streptomyces litmocidini]
MNALTRKFATVGSALAMAGSSLLLASSPASAATSCYASTCEGLDPSTTICQNDARTVMDSYYPGVELRYSPTCRAAWARYSMGAAFSFKVSVERKDSTMKFETPYYGNGATVWTRMINDAGLYARACGRVSEADWGCTGWY